jgi:hypothetical protein
MYSMSTLRYSHSFTSLAQINEPFDLVNSVCVCLSARHNCPKRILPVIRVTPVLSVVATGAPCLSLIIGFFPLIYPIDLISRALTRSRFGHPDQVER